MSGKLTIEAIGVPVAIEFTARPGDTLLLVNGVCVGVRSAGGKTAQPLAIEGPFIREVKSRGKGRYQPERDEEILRVLRQHGPQDIPHLAELLGYPLKHPDRRIWTQRIDRMLRREQLKVIREDRNKVRGRRLEPA